MAKKPNKTPLRKKTTVADQTKLLRKWGLLTGKASKAKVAKVWGKVKRFAPGAKQRFEFQKLSKRERAALQKGLNKKQFVPNGVFIRVPTGATKLPTYKVRKDGTIDFHAYGPKGGKMHEEIHPIDPKLLAEDPPRAIHALQAKAKLRNATIILTVNGFDSIHTREYSIDALAWYIANDLLPKFLDPNKADEIEAGYNNAHNKARKVKTIKQFVDTFHIKIIKHASAKAKLQYKRRIRKVRR